MTDQECIDGTLKWCNEMRKERGKPPLSELPKGKRYNPQTCPCGEATGLVVGAITYEEMGQTLGWLPPEVKEFIPRFDAGYLPQFDILL